MASPEDRKASTASEQIEEKDTSPPAGLSYTLDPATDRRLTRKLDLHILPWIFVLWLLAFIDRSNIGNAKLDGLVKDLKLTGDKYNVCLAVFYILYVLLDVPSNWLLRYVGGGRYLPLLAMAWGIVGTCMGTVKTYGGLIACRLFLGACEGGMFGGIILYLSMFYRRHDLMFRLGIFYCAAPLSGAFGGLLATGLAEINYGSYRSWPWIFFVEGSVTVVVAMVAFFFLPSTPGTARFLSEEEQWQAAQRLRVDLHGAAAVERPDEDRFNWREVRFALLNVNTIVMSLNFFFILIPIYSYSLFLPTIIKGMGYSRVTAQLFTVPPNFLAFLSVLAFAWTSDRIKMRGPLIAIALSLASVGYIMQLASDRNSVQYAGTFFIALGSFPCSPLVLAWLSNNLMPHTTKATGLGFQVAIGNCGAFVATFTYLAEDAPDYVTGHAICLASIGISLLLTLSNIAYIRWENGQRQSGRREYRLQEVEDESQLGYRHPEFRYTS